MWEVPDRVGCSDLKRLLAGVVVSSPAEISENGPPSVAIGDSKVLYQSGKGLRHLECGLLTAVSNDIGGDMIFAQQVYGYGRQGNVLIAISTSGRSRNVVYAVQVGDVCPGDEMTPEVEKAADRVCEMLLDELAERCAGREEVATPTAPA